jgi:hypothetical protein
MGLPPRPRRGAVTRQLADARIRPTASSVRSAWVRAAGRPPEHSTQPEATASRDQPTAFDGPLFNYRNGRSANIDQMVRSTAASP